MNEAERTQRKDLSDCYRLFDWMGWSELIFNHITLRLPRTGTSKNAYLINKFGTHYAEMTPQDLVAIDLEGNVLDGTDSKVNRAGFVIHSGRIQVRSATRFNEA